jgi:hypothetical protein
MLPSLFASVWIMDTASDEVKTNKIIMDRSSEFTIRRVAKLESMGDGASSAGKHDEVIAVYSAARSLSSPKDVLVKWGKTVLVHGSVNGVLSAAIKIFNNDVPKCSRNLRMLQ